MKLYYNLSYTLAKFHTLKILLSVLKKLYLRDLSCRTTPSQWVPAVGSSWGIRTRV